MDNQSIGVFDSGTGGLTVARQIMKVLPNEQMIYFGDTRRMPYGSKSLEELKAYTAQGLKFLEKHEPKAIILACNTMSANCYDWLCSLTDIPLVEIIEYGVQEACAVAKTKIGLIATEATVKSGAYRRLLVQKNNELVLLERACPLFAPLAEEGLGESAIAYELAKHYLEDFIKEDIDTLLLGCTHYPLLYNSLRAVLPEHVAIADPAVALAKALKINLEKNDKLRDSHIPTQHEFFVSGEPERFDKVLKYIIGAAYSSSRAYS